MMNASYSLIIIALVALILTINSFWAGQHPVESVHTETHLSH